jgi:hypothetical protein
VKNIKLQLDRAQIPFCIKVPMPGSKECLDVFLQSKCKHASRKSSMPILSGIGKIPGIAQARELIGALTNSEEPPVPAVHGEGTSEYAQPVLVSVERT